MKAVMSIIKKNAFRFLIGQYMYIYCLAYDWMVRDE